MRIGEEVGLGKEAEREDNDDEVILSRLLCQIQSGTIVYFNAEVTRVVKIEIIATLCYPPSAQSISGSGNRRWGIFDSE